MASRREYTAPDFVQDECVMLGTYRQQSCPYPREKGSDLM